MIIKEIVEINGKEYERTYSDEGRYVVRDGVEYGEAIDPLNSGREYTEGDLIPQEEETDTEEATEQDYLDALEELGVNTDEEN